MTKIGGGDGGRVGQPPGRSSNVEEVTTPFLKRKEQKADQTQEGGAFDDRPLVTDESRAFAKGKFQSDVRSQVMEKSLQTKADQSVASAAPVRGLSKTGKPAAEVGKLPETRAAASVFKSAEAGVAALAKDFGVTCTGSFAAEELSRIHESISLLGPKEKAGIKGLTFERVKAHDGSGVAFAPHIEVDERTGARLRGCSVSFSDAAFPSFGDGLDRASTFGGVVRECVRAGEGRGASDVLADINTKAWARNRALEKEEPLRDAYADSFSGFPDAMRGLELQGAKETAAKAFNKAALAVNDACEQLRDATNPAELAAAETALATATKERDGLLKKMGPDQPARDACRDLAEKQTAFADARKGYATCAVALLEAQPKAKGAYTVLDPQAGQKDKP